MKSKLKKDFGNRIKYFRNRQGYTQEQLGALLNLSSSAVNRWEKGGSLS